MPTPSISGWCATRPSRLADSILDLSRLENRTAPLKTVPLDVSVPVMRSVEIHRALMDSLDLTMRESIEEGGMVSGDTDRLAQAFGNLIANAAHYTPAGGGVTVTVGVDATEAVVTVADTGIGVQRDDVERAFSRFWRSDAARERKRTGFGIGLSVVRAIVEQHGGRVSLEPNTDGPGTTATVRLPLMERKGRTAV
jgi:signal transduction histidine kinase